MGIRMKRAFDASEAIKAKWQALGGPDVPDTWWVPLAMAALSAAEFDRYRRLWVCDGCGSIETIEQIKGEYPEALSCCPERKMRPRHPGDHQ